MLGRGYFKRPEKDDTIMLNEGVRRGKWKEKERAEEDGAVAGRTRQKERKKYIEKKRVTFIPEMGARKGSEDR